MYGKNKCKILKQIRQRIAEENDIPLVTKECSFQGSCSGTCPRCESELRYLEQQLARRQALGKTVTVAALSLSLMAGAVGCSLGGSSLQGDVPNTDIPFISAPEATEEKQDNGSNTPIPLPVGTECDTGTEGEDELAGAPTLDPTEIVELEGDVAYIPVPGESETSTEEDESATAGMLPAVGTGGND